MSKAGRAWLSWSAAGALFALCGVLGILQYRWIGEVSQAERERLADSLRATLDRLSREFNAEILADCRSLLPLSPLPESGNREEERDVAARFAQWRQGTRHTGLFSRVALASVSTGGGERSAGLRILDPEAGIFRDAEWPAEWRAIHRRLEFVPRELTPGRGPMFGRYVGARGDAGLTLEIPLRAFAMAPGVPPPPNPERDPVWLLIELNRDYLSKTLLPQAVQRHLSSGGGLVYEVEVVTAADPPVVLYESDGGADRGLRASADASVGLLELGMQGLRDLVVRRGPGMGSGPDVMRDAGGGRGGRGPGPGAARWQMFVRHRAGSLEAVVQQTRRRNLAVTAGVLLLMIGALGALFRFTRRAQRLAELEMDFVAGVSHELRTPLAVIHTAAYNLKGRVAYNPAQVEQYGALIQKESGRLKELVEQVLDFARSKTERLVGEAEPLSVEAVIDDVLESSRSLVEQAGCVVEKSIQAGLPLVMGDRVALCHALGNLVGNAAKYGAKDGHWIGISAAGAGEDGSPEVEIRVADRGPGIPAEEQKHLFEPFYRGRRAIDDQVHGTGLGLNLAKKIVEAHGGRILLRSEPKKGTEVVVRIPAAADGAAA